MEQKKTSLKEKPLHLQTGFIAVMFALSFFVIPLIIGIVLLTKQKKFEDMQRERYYMIDEAEIYSTETKRKADEIMTQKKQEADLIIANANKEGKEIVKEQKKKAQDIIEKAEQKSADIVNQAEQKSADMMSTVAQNVAEAEKRRMELLAQIKFLNENTNDLKSELKKLEEKSIIEYTIISVDENITSEEYKSKYNLLLLEEKEMLKNDEAVIKKSYRVEQKVLNSAVKQLARCFNSETAAAISSVTVKNIDNVKSKIIKTFELLNKLFAIDEVELNKKFLKIKLQEADLLYAYEYQKEQEKLQQKAIKEQMIEEEKVRREIEKEKAKVQKEETQFKNEISKLMSYMQKSSEVEKQLYIDKIKELEEKLKAVEKEKEDVLNREQNTRAGFVYIISNIGSFGENVYKIGMTRRLEPMDRINELSSASVPFEFDVHAMIFSEDAPALENALHKHFDKCKVNKVNPRKEFYRVDLDEVEKVVKENYNGTVTFTKVAEAYQYRESLRLAEESA